jgi:CAAX prenyl protease-like protein
MFSQQASAATRILPFAVYILFLALDQPLSQMMSAAGLDARWLYGYRVGCVAMLLVWLWRQYRELIWPFAVRMQGWLAALAVGTAVFALWIFPYPDWAVMGEASRGFSPLHADGKSIDPWLAAMRVAGAALVVPLMEELFWRSFLMRWLDHQDFLNVDPARISLRALAISSVLFAVEHSLWLAGLLAGLAYGWLYMRYRKLWVPVGAHAVTNGLLGLWVIQTGSWTYW